MGAAPRVTVYWFSQTGQLLESVSAVTDPLEKAGWDIRKVEITPRMPYPFPWPVRRFFGVFPASVDPAAAPEITARPPVPVDDDADLIVFAFPVWYLAPALPMRALVGAEPRAFAGRPVVGLVACRNMWYSAALEVRRLLEAAGGHYLGTIAAVDTASAGITFVTTLRWLLAGKREASWGFPRAGVPDPELDRLADLGELLAETDASAEQVRTVLAAQDAAPVNPPLAAADLLAGRAFRFWGRGIRRRGPAQRKALMGVFVLWLSGAIFAGLPVVVITRLLFRSGFDAAVARRLTSVVARLAEVPE
ncbi:hypothetical protein [Paractinoplanes lichenicola]|uniref:Dialkylrecorsinol condensing enzyme n=1 Tax=Paractinoplanes lichenicola TaxID=2802976 RepID=A0ABS1W6A7_9ACTN|nr:hypothetical protein [Actinoplanes lichenicola]MBL7262260.1 hypothetical protein [Actinoplanes lichenicola]